MKRIIMLFAVCFLFISCSISNQSVYDTGALIETKFASTVQKYAIWKAAAPEDVNIRWREYIDLLILQGDKLLDSYHSILDSGGNTMVITAEIDMLITQILIEIAKDRENK